MRRHQIYLDDRQISRLRAIARASGRTVSDLIRDAIDEKLDRAPEPDAFDAALAAATGLWRDRSDLEDTDAMVRRLREDRRGRREG